MDVLQEEDNKESNLITIQDFPFICRICLKRNDLRLFEEKDYLLDLFHAVRKIDVYSGVDGFPKNVCNDCFNKLEDILLFINILKLKYKKINSGEKMQLEEDIESIGENDSVISQKCIVVKRSQICGICMSPSDNLIPFEKKAHLLELFLKMAGIDVKTGFSPPSERKSMCDKCINELEKIASFLSSSLCNDKKLENAIGKNDTVKSELPTSEEWSLGIEGIKTEDISAGNSFSRDTEEKLGVIDIKQERFDSELVTSVEQIYQRESKLSPQSGEEPLTYEMNIEYDSFPHEDSLQGHSVNDNEGKLFKCVSCEKCFDRKNDLNKHLFTHTGEKPFKCDCCDKCFSWKGTLNRHMLTHTGRKPFQCDSCDKCFSLKLTLKRHMLTHTGEKPFNCDLCDKRFSQKGSLNQHVLTHTRGKPFKCDCCDNSFSLKSTLNNHMVIHTEGKLFQCDCCDRYFSRKGDLNKHMFTHTGEKPFKCDICDKYFSKKGSLNQHMLTHTRGKPFKCECCDKCFSLKSTLKRHMLTHTRD